MSDKQILEKIKEYLKLDIENFSKVIRLMKKNGSVKYCLNRARDFVDSAINETREMPHCDEIETMRQVAKYIISRKS